MKPLILIILFFVAFLGTALPLGAARSLQSPCTQPKWEITSPTSGAQIFGTVEIRGSACLAGDFDRYKFEYLPPGGSGWVWVFDGSQEVMDGLLGVWDTTPASNTFGDGVYNILLTVVRRDANYVQTPLRQVVLSNLQPEETPTPEVTLTPATTPSSETPTPIIIPQPTVFLVQPTPPLQVIITPGNTTPDNQGRGAEGFLDLGSLGTACLVGALAALLSFGAAGVVMVWRRTG